MLERYHKLQSKPTTLAELKAALPLRNDMPLEPINNAVEGFNKRLKACVQANVDTLKTQFAIES